jgi:polyisoprenoid-binding protein YceI
MKTVKLSNFRTFFAVLALVVVTGVVMAVPLDVKAKGKKTFYVNSRAGNSQVTVLSQSTLEDFTTVCNKVAGQCEVDPQNLELFKGRFSLRVEDLRTGIELRDKDLRSPDWFDAAHYPEVVVEVTKVEDVKKADPNTANMKLIGSCTIHGKTVPVTISGTLAYLDESPQTMKLVKGDVIRLRAEFDVKLSDFGVSGPAGSGTIGLKVSDVQNVKVTVFAATEAPPPPLAVDKEPATTTPVAPPPPVKKP